MGRFQNIFYGIVNSENSMTELLCNFMTYEPFRNSFLDLFLEQGKDSISYEDFRTQYITNVNQSRPDMAIVNDECEILVEVKTWDTGLTSNQPESYLDSLSNSKKPYKCLVFLVPSNYTHLSEWNQRVDKWDRLGKNNVPVKIVNWDEIIRIIERKDFHSSSDKFSDFYDLLKSWFRIEPIMFNTVEVNYMFNSGIPQILAKLYAIVDGVKNHCSQIYTVSRSVNNEEYGIYIKNQKTNEPVLYLGVWYDFWQEHKYPLCFGVNLGWAKKLINKFSANHKDDSIDFNGYRMVCIDKEVFNDEHCLEKIISLINAELQRLT